MLSRAKQEELSAKACAILQEVFNKSMYRDNLAAIEAAGAMALYPVFDADRAALLPQAVEVFERLFNGQHVTPAETVAASVLVNATRTTESQLARRLAALLPQAESELTLALDKMSEPSSLALWKAARALLAWHNAQ